MFYFYKKIWSEFGPLSNAFKFGLSAVSEKLAAELQTIELSEKVSAISILFKLNDLNEK